MLDWNRGQDPATEMDVDYDGILTPGQREFLAGDIEPPYDTNDRQQRYRIKNRMKGALRDFRFLAELPREDIQDVMEDFYTAGEGEPDKDHQGVFHAIFYLLYTGLHGGNRFERPMKGGILDAIARREIEERDVFPFLQFTFDVRIDSERSINLDDTVQALQNYSGSGAPDWFTPRHYDGLALADRLDELPEQQQDFLRALAMEKSEQAEKEQVKEWIQAAHPNELGTWRTSAEQLDLLDVLEVREKEIVETVTADVDTIRLKQGELDLQELAANIEDRGVTRGDLALLRQHGYFGTGEVADRIADHYHQRLNYIRHLQTCSGVTGDDYDGSMGVTPEMFDPEMEQAHKVRARELYDRYQSGEKLTKDQYDCLLSEYDEEFALDYEGDDVEDEYREALREDRGEWVPSEYRGPGDLPNWG